jgi:hypothetical protein
LIDPFGGLRAGLPAPACYYLFYLLWFFRTQSQKPTTKSSTAVKNDTWAACSARQLNTISGFTTFCMTSADVGLIALAAHESIT